MIQNKEMEMELIETLMCGDGQSESKPLEDNISRFDEDICVTNDDFILPENIWINGKMKSMSSAERLNTERQERYKELRVKFEIYDKDSNSTEQAIYTCRQDIPFNKNRKLQRLISALLGYIPRGNINMKELLIGKTATFKIKTYSQKDGSDIHYITEIK